MSISDDPSTHNAGVRRAVDRGIDAGYAQAQSGLNAARDGAHTAVASADEAVAAAQAYIRDKAAQQPLQTIAVAAGVGALVALIMRR